MSNPNLNEIKNQVQDKILDKISVSEPGSVILEWATGTGKSFMALKIARKFNAKNLLIVCPTKALCANWKGEIESFGLDAKVKLICKNSVHKETLSDYDMMIVDEAHLLSENNLNFLINQKIKPMSIFLSATFKDATLYYLKRWFNVLYVSQIDMSKAQELGMISDKSNYYLVPVTCEGEVYRYKETVWKKNKAGAMSKRYVETNTTARFIVNDTIKKVSGMCKYACGDRSSYAFVGSYNIVKQAWGLLKRNEMIRIARELKGQRAIFFCSSIEEANYLCSQDENSVSMNESSDALEKFNNHEYEHIYAVKMLDQGITPKDCGKVVISQIDKSNMATLIQRIGRAMRAEDPEIYILYVDGYKCHVPNWVNWDEREIILEQLSNLGIKYRVKTKSNSNVKVCN